MRVKLLHMVLIWFCFLSSCVAGNSPISTELNPLDSGELVSQNKMGGGTIAGNPTEKRILSGYFEALRFCPVRMVSLVNQFGGEFEKPINGDCSFDFEVNVGQTYQIILALGNDDEIHMYFQVCDAPLYTETLSISPESTPLDLGKIGLFKQEEIFIALPVEVCAPMGIGESNDDETFDSDKLPEGIFNQKIIF